MLSGQAHKENIDSIGLAQNLVRLTICIRYLTRYCHAVQKAAKLTSYQERDLAAAHRAYLDRTARFAEERARIFASLQVCAGLRVLVYQRKVLCPFCLAHILVMKPRQVEPGR